MTAAAIAKQISAPKPTRYTALFVIIKATLEVSYDISRRFLTATVDAEHWTKAKLSADS